MDEAISIARRLPLSVEEWLTGNDPCETWLPPHTAYFLIRENLIEPDDIEGGYVLTDLGKEVRAILKEEA